MTALRVDRLSTARGVLLRTASTPRGTRQVEEVARATVAVAWLALGVHALKPAHGHGAGAAMAGWVVMTVAMMGPPALPAIRHVAESSLRWRRSRAALEFAVVYLAVWAVAGAVALTAASALPRIPATVAAALAVAALWQLTPMKWRSLWDCHRAVPLPPTGIRAVVGCARFALLHGRACVGSCWAVMAVMAVAPAAHLLGAAALTPVMLYERRARRPRRAARQSAVALGLAALAVAAASTL